MKRYCFDMSGLSNPLERLPLDIYKSIWEGVEGVLKSGDVAVTREIYDEMLNLPGKIGVCIQEHQEELLMEVGQGEWDWVSYGKYAAEMQVKYKDVISEFNGGRSNTISLNDVSIIALGKALALPVVSMEAMPGQISERKKRIPEVCRLEGVLHYDFNDFLRKEGITS